MQRTAQEIDDDAIPSKDHALDRFVIGQHGNNRIASARLGDAAGCLRALCNECAGVRL
jgi:hypothetical protein